MVINEHLEKRIQTKFSMLKDEQEHAENSMNPFKAAEHAKKASRLAIELMEHAFEIMGVKVCG